MTFSDISDERVGERGTWTIPSEDGQEISFSGLFLAFSSSHSDTHHFRAHPEGIEKNPIPILDSDGKSMRCSACRWSEFRIFKEEDQRVGLWPYLIHYAGLSSIPGEVTRYRPVKELLTAREVIEELTTRKGDSVRLSIPAAKLLAQAAEIDNGNLKEAYDARRVP